MKTVTGRDLGDETPVAGEMRPPPKYSEKPQHLVRDGIGNVWVWDWTGHDWWWTATNWQFSPAKAYAEGARYLCPAELDPPVIAAAKEWSAARADCMTKAVTPGSFARLALAEAALQSAVNSLKAVDPARRSDGQAEI